MYGCTTIRVVVVRLKGVVTRLSRSAEPSGNLREAVSFNSRSSLLKLKETSLWTQRNVSFRLFNHILSLIQTSEYAYSIISFCLFKHLNTPAELSPSSGRTGCFIELSFLAGDEDAALSRGLIYLLAIEIMIISFSSFLYRVGEAMKVVPETMSKRMNFWVKIPTVLFLFATKYARFLCF